MFCAAHLVIISRFPGDGGRGAGQGERSSSETERGWRVFQFKENLSDSEGRLSGKQKQQIQMGDGFAGSHPGSWR